MRRWREEEVLRVEKREVEILCLEKLRETTEE
jgi:hypothetical protein